MSEQNKTALIVIYNHNYEKNIEKIRRIYSSRFSCIAQIMPFYRGADPDVIGVYEASWQFNGYITQAWPRIKAMGSFSHYLVIADDIILNPELNEDNVVEKMQLPPGAAYIQELQPIGKERFVEWKWSYPAYAQMLLKGNHCEFSRFIPDVDEAVRCFERHGMDRKDFVPRGFVDTFLVSDFSAHDIVGSELPVSLRGCISWLLKKIIFFFAIVTFWIRRPFSKITADRTKFRQNLLFFSRIFAKRTMSKQQTYPLAGGYSDTLLLPADKMDDFAHLCGVFAAMRLFVEIAIPTALVFTMDKIVTDKTAPYKGLIMWGRDRKRFVKEHNQSLSHLMEHYPEGTMFCHPIKLSNWNMDI